MGEVVGLIAELKGPLGGFMAVAIAIGLYLWRERGQRAVGAANDAANISAIDHWKEVASRGDKALEAMTLRADKFAEERNQALQMVGEMKGQLIEMNRQLENQARLLQLQADKLDQQASEMHGLRGQVDSLKEQLNAKH
jgi:polyhydroxyalkanoate synthesis regulator phasin